MRTLLQLLMTLGCGQLAAQSAFTSIHTFGDGVCTTNGNTSGLSFYYDNNAVPNTASFCNGRVWIEVLAQWQGLPYIEANNISYFGHDSDELLVNLASYTAPGDIGTALYIIWVNDADLVEFMNINTPPYDASDIPTWNSLIDAAVQNHEDAINDLYTLGVRTLVLPRAVDVPAAPFYALSASDAAFVRARINNYNAELDTMLATLLVSLSDLEVYQPDTFAFFDDVLANPSDYGAINPGIDAVSDLGTPAFAGPGAEYVFWDPFHPSANVQMHLADLVQQMITPVDLGSISETMTGGEVTIVNAPIGREGILEGSDDLQNWTLETNFTPTGTTHTESVSTANDARFFRAGFPVEWVFP